VYLHVLEWGSGALQLAPLGRRIVGCRALTGGQPRLKVTGDGLEIRLTRAARDATDTIIALDLDGPAASIKPISALVTGAISVGAKASASSIWSADYDAQKAFDGSEDTRWGGEPNSRSGWLQVDLGAARTFDRVVILEAPWNRVRRFQLQWRNGEADAWTTFHEGAEIGDLDLHFPPVTARYFRLNVLEATEVPTIWEVLLYYAPGAGPR
jgi:alpha-L-fucosidase